MRVRLCTYWVGMLLLVMGVLAGTSHAQSGGGLNQVVLGDHTLTAGQGLALPILLLNLDPQNLPAAGQIIVEYDPTVIQFQTDETGALVTDTGPIISGSLKVSSGNPNFTDPTGAIKPARMGDQLAAIVVIGTDAVSGPGVFVTVHVLAAPGAFSGAVTPLIIPPGGLMLVNARSQPIPGTPVDGQVSITGGNPPPQSGGGLNQVVLGDHTLTAGQGLALPILLLNLDPQNLPAGGLIIVEYDPTVIQFQTDETGALVTDTGPIISGSLRLSSGNPNFIDSSGTFKPARAGDKLANIAVIGTEAVSGPGVFVTMHVLAAPGAFSGAVTPLIIPPGGLVLNNAYSVPIPGTPVDGQVSITGGNPPPQSGGGATASNETATVKVLASPAAAMPGRHVDLDVYFTTNTGVAAADILLSLGGLAADGAPSAGPALGPDDRFASFAAAPDQVRLLVLSPTILRPGVVATIPVTVPLNAAPNTYLSIEVLAASLIDNGENSIPTIRQNTAVRVVPVPPVPPAVIDPRLQAVTCGGTTPITLSLDSGTNVTAIDATFTYNPAFGDVAPNSAKPVGLAAQPGAQAFVDSVPGSGTFRVVVLSPTAFTVFSGGSRPFVQLQFKTTAACGFDAVVPLVPSHALEETGDEVIHDVTPFMRMGYLYASLLTVSLKAIAPDFGVPTPPSVSVASGNVVVADNHGLLQSRNITHLQLEQPIPLRLSAPILDRPTVKNGLFYFTANNGTINVFYPFSGALTSAGGLGIGINTASPVVERDASGQPFIYVGDALGDVSKLYGDPADPRFLGPAIPSVRLNGSPIRVTPAIGASVFRLQDLWVVAGSQVFELNAANLQILKSFPPTAGAIEAAPFLTEAFIHGVLTHLLIVGSTDGNLYVYRSTGGLAPFGVYHAGAPILGGVFPGIDPATRNPMIYVPVSDGTVHEVDVLHPDAQGVLSGHVLPVSGLQGRPEQQLVAVTPPGRPNHLILYVPGSATVAGQNGTMNVIDLDASLAPTLETIAVQGNPLTPALFPDGPADIAVFDTTAGDLITTVVQPLPFSSAMGTPLSP